MHGTRGIRFSQMANGPVGQLTRSAVVLVVCDLPAARHLACLAGVGSHWICSTCNCYHKSNYGRTDFHNWTWWDNNSTRQYAEQWRDAATSAEHDRIFKGYGIHYSELWCLLYWNPARQLVVDPMHWILEGLVKHHVHNLLGLATENPNSADA
jgi:hypothetical protein